MLSINAASAALACSGITWAGPVGAVRMAVPAGGGAPIASATREQAGAAALSALVVGTESGILYIEAEVKLLPTCVASVRFVRTNRRSKCIRARVVHRVEKHISSPTLTCTLRCCKQGSEASEEVLSQTLHAAMPAIRTLIAAQRDLAARTGAAKQQDTSAGVDPLAVAVVTPVAQPFVEQILR